MTNDQLPKSRLPAADGYAKNAANRHSAFRIHHSAFTRSLYVS